MKWTLECEEILLSNVKKKKKKIDIFSQCVKIKVLIEAISLLNKLFMIDVIFIIYINLNKPQLWLLILFISIKQKSFKHETFLLFDVVLLLLTSSGFSISFFNHLPI